MANWSESKTFFKHDDYMTPSYAWEWVKDYIPKDKVIWEPFYGDGTSGKTLEELGFQVIHKKEDFFESNYGDIIVSNPPFSKAKEILPRLKQLNKPFMLIMPTAKITKRYCANLFKNDRLQILIPPKRINFIKFINGKKTIDLKDSRCWFDCLYYCWKMDLPKDIIFL